MKLTFLSADRVLTKTYIFSPDGSYDALPYPLTATFTSHEVEVSTIEEFHAELTKHAALGHCLLKGNLQRSITRESRAGLVASETTGWELLDFDGLDLKGQSLDDVLTDIGTSGCDYILQYSASQGIKKDFNAHVFLMLDTPTAADNLKRWLKWKNLSVPFLRDQIALTKTDLALHWPLDITVCQNDKLIYIAPPIISGGPDPIPDRISLVKKANRTVSVSAVPGNVEEQAARLIEQLRSAKGLPDRKFVTIYSKPDQTDVLKDPDQVDITGVKRHGDFTYVNVNSGDSWGYFHLTNKPEILSNFKGEPNYRLRELCPEYYKNAKLYARESKLDAHRPKELNGKPKKWIINRRSEGKYYKVTYKPDEGVILDPAPTLKHVEDWCLINKIPMPDTIEDWEINFNPTKPTTVDPVAKTINTYKPTKFKLASKKVFDFDEQVDPYLKLVYHMCGSDQVATDRFLNWLSFIWQTGKKPKTAWVLHGTYGTGKGRFGKVLSHLFGEQYVVTGPESVSEHFNASIERAQVLWIDEVTTDAWDGATITPKLRNWITEDTLSLRVMRKDSVNISSYMGIIIAANEHNPVEIRFGDRRYNVAPRQEIPLLEMPWAIDALIDDEFGILYQDSYLQSFANYLESYKVDVAKVRVPLENAAKNAVMKVTQSLPEDIVHALEVGDTSFFIEYVQVPGSLPTMEGAEYKQIMEKLMRGGLVPLKTQEIRKIFEYLAGWNQKAAKFNKAAAKYGLHLAGKVVRDGKSTYAGVSFDFKVTDDDKRLWAQLNEDTSLKVVRGANEG